VTVSFKKHYFAFVTKSSLLGSGEKYSGIFLRILVFARPNYISSEAWKGVAMKVVLGSVKQATILS